MKFLTAFTTVLAISLVSCGSKDSDSTAPTPNGQGSGNGTGIAAPEFRTETLAGKINGKDWTFVTGKAKIRKSEKWSSVLIDFYSYQPEDFRTGEPLADICDAWGGPSSDNAQPSVSLYVNESAKAGEITEGYQDGINRMLSISFKGPDGQYKNLGTSQWQMRMDKKDDAEIGGAFVGKYDDNNSLNGVFSVKFCKEN